MSDTARRETWIRIRPIVTVDCLALVAAGIVLTERVGGSALLVGVVCFICLWPLIIIAPSYWQGAITERAVQSMGVRYVLSLGFGVVVSAVIGSSRAVPALLATLAAVASCYLPPTSTIAGACRLVADRWLIVCGSVGLIAGYWVYSKLSYVCLVLPLLLTLTYLVVFGRLRRHEIDKSMDVP